MTSITSILQQTGTIYCYFSSSTKDWKKGNPANLNNCYESSIFIIIVGFIPAWLRFMQCFRRYKDTSNLPSSKRLPNLYNAGKYFLQLLVPLSSIWLVKFQFDSAFWAYFAIRIISTTYSYLWDLYFDWGLLRSFDRKKIYYGLRPKLTFHVIFYYWSIFSNLLLRFFWVIFIWQNFVIWDDKDKVDLAKSY